HQFPHLVPGAFGSGDVPLQVLGFPGKAFAHGVPDDAVSESRKGRLFARGPGPLDELDDTDPAMIAEHPQCKPEGCRRLALAWAGMNHEKTLLQGLLGHFRILNSLSV